MQFSVIESSTETSTVGHWPQLIDLRNCNRSDTDAFDDLLSRHAFPPHLPRTDGFQLHPSAKITDLLSNKFLRAYVALCVSDRMNSILDQFELCNVRTQRLSIDASPDIADYHAIFIMPCAKIVDFSNSSYTETDILARPEGPVHTFASDIELMAKAENLLKSSQRGLAPLEIALRSTPDLFRIPWDFRIHVSAQLRSRLESERLSGITFKKTSIRFVEINKR